MKRLMMGMAVALMMVGVAQAALLVDRGLPTANLNNAAGTSRSNVAWADPPYMVGDDFTLPGTSATSYQIDTIRVWAVVSLPASGLSLWLGTGNDATLTKLNVVPTTSVVTYQDGSTYQSTSGSPRTIYEVDFTNLDLIVAGGTKVDFAVYATSGLSADYVFLHASNAADGGVPADGADGLVQLWNLDGTYAGDFNSDGNGWDKSSDINVQVEGDPVPEPATLIIWSLLGGLGLAVSYWRRKRAA